MYRKGYSIFDPGKPIPGLYVVQQGMVKEYISGPGNKMEIIRFANNGHAFGHPGYKNETYAFGAEAKVDSTVCFFENKALYELILLNPKSVFDFMLFYSSEHSESLYRSMSISQMNLRQKIAMVLYYFYRRFGLNSEKEILDCFTREDIANLACTTLEQVSRQLSEFEEENIIEKRARKIAILHSSKLKSIIKNYIT